VPAVAPVPRPAAPTQVGLPGQVPLPPQPQYAPPPGAPRQPATGFPHYVSPPPSPPDHTTLYVGILVCMLTLLFAVVGFVLVA
jgi:hypothetical protein